MKKLKEFLVGFRMPLVVSGVVLLAMLMENYLGKVRSNFFFGIRTPWTLSSELSWGKTHRLGGRLFVFLGLVLAVGTMVKGPGILPLLAPALLTLVVALAGYSYLVWRNDPNKHALGR